MSNIAQVVNGEKNMTTLKKGVQASGLSEVLSGKGPFTVFAPTNEAFDKLPEGTLKSLMQNDKIASLQNILQYHVTLSALKVESFHNGQTLGMVNGDNVTVSVVDGKVTLNNSAHIIASVPASNGMIHIIDAVLLPPQK